MASCLCTRQGMWLVVYELDRVVLYLSLNHPWQWYSWVSKIRNMRILSLCQVFLQKQTPPSNIMGDLGLFFIMLHTIFTKCSRLKGQHLSSLLSASWQKERKQKLLTATWLLKFLFKSNSWHCHPHYSSKLVRLYCFQ